ncbi:MAG: hypothetical protein CME62_00315 [Halobacteriovoraceae bacterium]|nr:hypothetical protein [Halobacteriovoraceae bacterium]|tara:strand:- start:290 stop:973 length:684 start_codon:yes stop_codon:yes gene_type:complete
MVSKKLKVLTYNIHGFVDFKKKNRKSELTSWLLKHDADIIALQEVKLNTKHEFVRHMEQKYKVYCAPTLTTEQGEYGNILLSKYPAQKKIIHDLSFKKKEPRNCVELHLNLGPQKIRIFAMHLGLSQWEKIHQIKRLFHAIIKHNDGVPELVLGDFNHVIDWPLLRYYLYKGRFNYIRSRTFPARFPLFKLDQIWFRDFHLLNMCRFNHKSASFSDHLPLGAEFILK